MPSWRPQLGRYDWLVFDELSGANRNTRLPFLLYWSGARNAGTVRMYVETRHDVVDCADWGFTGQKLERKGERGHVTVHHFVSIH